MSLKSEGRYAIDNIYLDMLLLKKTDDDSNVKY